MASDNPLTLGFAGTFLSLKSDDREVREHIESRYGAFSTETAAPAHLLEIAVDPALDQSDPNRIEIGLNDGLLEAESSSLELEFEFAPGGGSGLLRIAPGQLFIDIENSLRVLVAHSVSRRGALLVHAAAFGEPGSGRVALFAGYSGAGKSTISALAAREGLEVISDDIVLVDPSGKTVAAAATPLGSLEGPDPRPCDEKEVAGVYFIEHGEENSITPLDPAAALLRLASVVPFTPSSGTEAFQEVLEAAARVVEGVDSGVFAFRPDASAVKYFKGRC